MGSHVPGCDFAEHHRTDSTAAHGGNAEWAVKPLVQAAGQRLQRVLDFIENSILFAAADPSVELRHTRPKIGDQAHKVSERALFWCGLPMIL